jgi:hypothetical protein
MDCCGITVDCDLVVFPSAISQRKIAVHLTDIEFTTARTMKVSTQFHRRFPFDTLEGCLVFKTWSACAIILCFLGSPARTAGIQLLDSDSLPGKPDIHVVPAGHFAFLAPCSPQLATAIPRICTDNPAGFDRAAFHHEFNASVVGFFREHLVGDGAPH